MCLHFLQQKRCYLRLHENVQFLIEIYYVGAGCLRSIIHWIESSLKFLKQAGRMVVLPIFSFYIMTEFFVKPGKNECLYNTFCAPASPTALCQHLRHFSIYNGERKC